MANRSFGLNTLLYKQSIFRVQYNHLGRIEVDKVPVSAVSVVVMRKLGIPTGGMR